MKTYVAYYRVSTTQQGKSGLGLEAQRKSVKDFIKNDSLILEYTDIESGKNDKRPQLAAAIAACKREGATLVIAKLDRLARKVSFITALMDSGVEFIACDMPQANKFTIHIFAALAEQEREFISERTKKALAAKKERGESLGNPQNFTAAGRLLAKEVRINNAKNNENKNRARNYAAILQSQGLTLQSIADRLNTEGFKTSRGKEFFAATVERLIKEKVTINKRENTVHVTGKE